MPFLPLPGRRLARAAMVSLGLMTGLASTVPLHAQPRVDVALVLAVDASDSVGGEMLDLQRRGHIDALNHPAIAAAIRHGRHGQIAVAYIEWSGSGRQRLMVPFTVIASAEDAAAFAVRIDESIGQTQGATAIGEALRFAGALLTNAGVSADRHVIDLSANGFWNAGIAPTGVRDMLVDAGITINGLPILGGPGPAYDKALENHFAECVVGGEGSFWLPVMDPSDFTATLIQKMTYEIAGYTPPQPERVYRAAARKC